MSKISMDKKYTCAGVPVRILCVDGPGLFPVVAVVNSMVLTFNHEGYCANQSTWQDRALKLEEVMSYTDFKVDQKVMVRYGYHYEWLPRYFSHADETGSYAFMAGSTSWSGDGKTSHWNECRLPTPEELRETK